MKAHNYYLFTLLFLGLQISTSWSQTNTHFNPNAVLDMGLTIGHLDFHHKQGTAADLYDSWANRVASRFKECASPNPQAIQLDGSTPTTFSREAMEEHLQSLKASFMCPPLFSLVAEEIFTTGFSLGQVYATAGTACSDCLIDALLDAELDLNSLSYALLDNGAEKVSQRILAISENLRDASEEITKTDDLDETLRQNEQAGQLILQSIALVDDILVNKLLDCQDNQSDIQQSGGTCQVTELVLISEDSTSKTLVARSDSETFQWRYKQEGSNWIYPQEADSVLRIEKVSPDTYIVEVKVWCANFLDFSNYIPESLFYTYQSYYGCYAPHIKWLYATHVKQNSAYMNCNVRASKVKWAYRQVGGSWRYLTSSKKSIYYYNLEANTTYEFKCKIWCGYNWSSWSHSRRFTTRGSYCHPATPTVSHISPSSARTTTRHHGKKRWAFRKRGGQWKVYTNSYAWMTWNCQPNTTYEVKISIICHGRWSPWCTPVSWTTGGNCHKPTYSSMRAYNITQTTASTSVSRSAARYSWAIRPIGGHWKYFERTSSTINWSKLSPNTTYEYKVSIYCHPSWTSYSSMRTFRTKGYSCHAPSSHHIWYSNLSSSSVTLHINTSASKIQYAIYRAGLSDWLVWERTSRSITITNMRSSTKYYYKMRIYCNGRWSTWSPTEYLYTKSYGRSADRTEGKETSLDGLEADEEIPYTPEETQKEVSWVNSPVVIHNTLSSLDESKEEVANKLGAELTVYPNPTADYIKVGGFEGKMSISVANMQGQMMIHGREIDRNTDLDLSACVPGQYILTMITEDGKRQVEKISVVR
ncbi:MAG: T9SS type A sorting domain-containing protein [Saprospiraceae bacterium]|nr:T9SS type A sorting domain-containing protein [Saprospiraceae bacterium]